jgi:hypothetical protein
MRGKKLQEYCIEILSLKDLYIRGRINQMMGSSIESQSKVAALRSNADVQLSKEYIQSAVNEFYTFRNKLLDFDSQAFEETLDIIIGTEYSDFNDLYFNEAMEQFFGSKHTIGFVSAYNDYAEDFNALVSEFLILKPE